MSKESASFTIEGELGELWDQAEKEFLSSEIAASYKKVPEAECTKHPTEWLESFQKHRNRDERLLVTCRKVGKHLEIIQAFVKALGFSVQVASAVSRLQLTSTEFYFSYLSPGHANPFASLSCRQCICIVVRFLCRRQS